MKKLLYPLLLPLLLVLGGCSKAPVVETDNKGSQQQEVKPTEEAPVNPNLKYQIKGDAVTITGCDKKASGELIIPDTIEGNPVTSIEEKTFYDCKSLTAVTFLGDAPKAGKGVFTFATPTIYRKPEAKGWGDTFAGRPVKLISEKP